MAFGALAPQADISQTPQPRSRLSGWRGGQNVGAKARYALAWEGSNVEAKFLNNALNTLPLERCRLEQRFASTKPPR
jgi:hypothetical protein